MRFLGLFVGQWQAVAQETHVPVHDPGNRAQLFEGQIALSSFDSADVAPHVLPPGFTKVRYYGLLGNNRRKQSIPAARRALEQSPHRVDGPPVPAEKPLAWLPQPCDRCGGLDRTQVGRTDSAGKFTGIIPGPMRLRLRIGEPPKVLNSS